MRYPLALALVGLVTGCSSVNIDSFNAWCEYVHNRTDPKYDVFAFSMDRDAVINGLVAAWDTIIVTNSSPVLGVDATDAYQDSLVIELRRSGVIGASRSGDTLYFGLTVVPSPAIAPGRTIASVFEDAFSRRLSQSSTTDGPASADPIQYCLYEGIDLFFAQLSIAAADGTAKIKTDGYHKLKDLE